MLSLIVATVRSIGKDLTSLPSRTLAIRNSLDMDGPGATVMVGGRPDTLHASTIQCTILYYVLGAQYSEELTNFAWRKTVVEIDRMAMMALDEYDQRPAVEIRCRLLGAD